jgi:hypothetical protein
MRLLFPHGRSSARLNGSQRLAVVGWLAVLCVLGAAYVSALAGASEAVLLAASVLAALATLALGGQLGYVRDWPNLGAAVLTGTLVLIGWAEITWIATFFIPIPGGSGGMLEILGPIFYGVIAGVLGLAVLAVILVAGALLGRGVGLLLQVVRASSGA